MNRLGDKARAFSGDDVERLKSFAAQAAIALENARLFAENRRQVETLSVLHELSRAVTGELERTALVEAIGREVARVSGVVDWVEACVGPLAVDSARARLNLAWFVGLDAARRYARCPGVIVDPVWDIVDSCDLGSSDLPGPDARHGREAFVADALSELG